MPFKLSATQIAGKAENTEGTKETLAANDCVLVKGCTFNPNIEMYERDLMIGTLSRDPALSGNRSCEVTFDCELVGQGNAGVAPPWGKFLLGCGFNEAVANNTSVTYKPTTSNMTNSMTIGIYQDGLVKRCWGARGTVNIILEAGKPGLLHFVFQGCDFEVDDLALLSPTYPTLLPPICLNTSLTVDSYAMLVSKIELAMDNVLSRRPSMNSTGGYISTLITGRNPKGTIDPEQMSKNAYDIFGKWKTPGTIGSLSVSANNGAGDTITITMPKVRYFSIKDTDRAGLRTLGVDFQACRNNSDDEISIVVT